MRRATKSGVPFQLDVTKRTRYHVIRKIPSFDSAEPTCSASKYGASAEPCRTPEVTLETLML